MATVHRAKERGIEGFERIVALKRLLPHLAEDESFVRSFVREAKLASMLQHPNIVQLYELGRVGAVYFISMEYIEGRDVRKILRQARRAAGPPPLGVFLALMVQLCDALEYAHGRTDDSGEPLGLVHRDVSPSNLLVTRSGHLKIIDFGIAKAQSQKLRTQTGRVKGKLAYMAPEAIKAQELDGRSDIFAAGVIAHELLTARPLFASKNEYQTILRVQRAEVEPPSRHNVVCPPELDDIVLAALARDASQRWSSAAEMRDALRAVGVQYQASATNNDVAEWMQWAFSLAAPKTRPQSQSGSHTGSQIGSTSPISYSLPSAPQRAFARRQTPTSPGGRRPEPVHMAAALPGELDDGDRDPPSDIRTAPLDIAGAPEVEIVAEAVEEDDERAVDFAWGQEQEPSKPVLLDEVPDVSHKAVDAERSAGAARAPASTVLGDDEIRGRVDDVDLRPGGGGKWLVGLAALAGAGAVAYVLLPGALPGQESPAAELPRTAALEFAVEPADAHIRIEGHGSHQGSPYRLDVEAPGTYRVEIARPGYTSYVTELEVAGGEKNVVRVTLSQAQGDESQVVVRSSPDRQRVFLDGKEQSERTPVTLRVSPGAHVLAIRDRGGDVLWRHEFKAAANTQYEFLPVLPRQRKRRRDRDRDDDSAIATVHAPEATPDGRPRARAGPGEVSGLAGSVSGSGLLSLNAAAPPAIEVPSRTPPVARQRPVTVPPTAVTKRSGALPTIPARRSDVPSRASAKLCIDPRGKVTSVRVLTRMPPRATSKLRRALKRWRYEPYVQDGMAVPACFAVNFELASMR